MNVPDTYGINRALEPRGSLPQPAWKINNTMELCANEILIDVKIISINLVSFNQMVDEANHNETLFKRRIMDIIQARGKLHNPVTGTGGMLYGVVLELGEQYPNRSLVQQGDQIISLMSLSLTPIRLDRILSVDYENAQLWVEGQCVLFANSPLMKKPEDLPLKLIVTAMDEAGAPTRTYRTIQPGHEVLIMGATGKVGLLCAFAARDKLGSSGRMVGMVKSQAAKSRLEQYGLFHEVVCMDATKVSQLYQSEQDCGIADRFDLVINCINSPGTELAGLMAVKDRGALYFSTLSSDYKLASLTAESIGKEVSIIPYSGFLQGHADYTLTLLRRYPQLQKALQFERSAEDDENQESLDDEVTDADNTNGYIFVSKEGKEFLRRANQVAPYNSNVIIYGESGVGKEIVARIIHQNSERKSFPMIKINCAAIPEHLLESELFGYEKGAFTGASAKGKVGLWEAAQNGTLFLDEVGELPLSFQAKLLRAIQEREIVRVGGISPIKIDVRIVAATNRNLKQLVAQRLFRADLYYRLNVFPLTVPPLRERRDDIIPLANFFVARYNREFQMNKSIQPRALHFLYNQPFLGNTRELQNLVQRLMITTDQSALDVDDIMRAIAYDQDIVGDVSLNELSPPVTAPPLGLINEYEGRTFKDMMGQMEESILRDCKKRFRSTRKIAEALRISQPTVVRKLKLYGIGDEDG